MTTRTRPPTPETTPKRRGVRTPVTKPKMFPGETIEYGLTAEVKHRGASWWAKCGAVVTIQEGESEASARKRLKEAVETYLEDAVNDIVNG